MIGGGGHCKSVINVLLECNNYDEIGIIDTRNNVGKIVSGIKIIGTDQELPYLINKGYEEAFITVGSVGNPKLRIKLYNMLCNLGYKFPNIISESSNVSKTVKLEDGVFIGKHAIVNVEAKIGSCSIINTGSIIEHECHIGEFCHVSPGAVLCGNVHVGDNSHIGANSTVIQNIKIGSNVVVGAGSVIISNIDDSKKIVGVPGKVIENSF